MKLADRITLELMRFCRTHAHDIIVPNWYYLGYEMDVLRIQRSGFVSEYEIKISRQDFFSDFKKGQRTSGRLAIEVYQIPYATYTKAQDTQYGRRANRFYYVMPQGLIALQECPVYAGLIYYDNGGFQIVKNAPLLHRRKHWLDMNQVALKLAFREQNWKARYQDKRSAFQALAREADALRQKLERAQSQLKQLKES